MSRRTSAPLLAVAVTFGAFWSLPGTASAASPAPATTPASCRNLPFSAAILDAQDCASTSAGVVAAGDVPGSADGVVALMENQQDTVIRFASAGALHLQSVSGDSVCAATASGAVAGIDLAQSAVTSAATGACHGSASLTPLSTDHSLGIAPQISQHAPRPAGSSRVASSAAPRTVTSPPPDASTSYYIGAANLTECNTGQTWTCPIWAMGASEAVPAGGAWITIDFGAQCQDPSTGVAGDQLFNESVCTPDATIEWLVTRFIAGYESANGSSTPRIILAAGTSNSVNGVANDPQTQPEMATLGAAWATSVVQATSTSALAAPITMWGALDAEQSGGSDWLGPGPTRAFVDAFGTATGHAGRGYSCSAAQPGMLADFGDAIYLQGRWNPPGGWSVADIYHVAWGAPVACAVPEIYYDNMAQEWASVSTWATQNGLPPIVFTAAMSENGVSGTETAQQSWQSLANWSNQNVPYLTNIAWSVVNTPAQSPPGAPTGVSVTPEDSAAWVTWAPPASYGGGAISEYTVAVYQGTQEIGYRTTTGDTAATVAPLANGTAYAFVVTGTNSAGTGAGSAAVNATPAAAAAAGRVTAIAPWRILDTRSGSSAVNQQHPGPLGPGFAMTIQVTDGGAHVPANAVAALLNVTETGATAPSYITVSPAGAAQPPTSSLNFPAASTVANHVEVSLGAAGKVVLFNSQGSANVIVDVEGYVVPGAATAGAAGLYQPLAPYRVCDTRAAAASNECNAPPATPLGAGAVRKIQIAGTGGANGVPVTGASAVVLNVTVADTTSAGYLTVFPDGASTPLASTVNWPGATTVANRVVVKLASDGAIDLYNAAGSADVIVDVNGWFTSGAGSSSGALFHPLTPSRVLDTRSGNGYMGSVAGGTPVTLSMGDRGGVPTSATAVVINVTVADSSEYSYLTVYPGSVATPPGVSDLNFGPGGGVANLVVVSLGSNGTCAFFNASGSTDVIADVVGYYA